MTTTFLKLEQLSDHLGDRTAHWISEPTVWNLHGERLGKLFGSIDPLLVPAGETAKTLTQLEKLLDKLINRNVRRDHVLVGCGGGALTDVTGLAAALALRGIHHLLIPTTLLSQVDAAIGGKTAVNLGAGKNLCGAFHFPKAVVIDRQFLETLPATELASGLGEVLKTGLLAGGQLWEDVLVAKALDDALLHKLAAYKDGVVTRDPYEQGERALLNLGHTAGHAWEALACGSHGQCIAWGIRFALQLAQLHGTGVKQELLNEIDGWLTQQNMSLTPENFVTEEFMSKLQLDKKAAHSLKWILPHGIGDCHIHDDVDESAIRTVLAHFQG